MRTPIVAGNWKMYKSPAEARSFFRDFISETSEREQNHAVFFPSAFSIEAAADCLDGIPATFGAQDCWTEDEGAFTGENSPLVLRELGAHWLLVGHSERRQLFGETDECIAKKVKVAQTRGLIPMLCIGETLEQRGADGQVTVWKQQLEKALETMDIKKPICIAYEPVWAIGTGKVASPEQVQEAHSMIRTLLKDFGGEAWAKQTPILYGGSVKPDNVEGLAQIHDVDGFLVGGASLKVDSFIEILTKTLRAKV